MWFWFFDTRWKLLYRGRTLILRSLWTDTRICKCSSFRWRFRSCGTCSRQPVRLNGTVHVYKGISLQRNNGTASVGSLTREFGVINWVDYVNWPPYSFESCVSNVGPTTWTFFWSPLSALSTVSKSNPTYFSLRPYLTLPFSIASQPILFYTVFSTCPVPPSTSTQLSSHP